ncbi:ArsC/Spx/MgsR family protein [Flavobacterium xanthum]|uniref:Arsenate reductase n=1 Tax=Flavobacterium xanthum TaxID=69322 RepID=A0A1M7GCV4_9FLAO|nr:ArsC/Spx/MgsR family protein [Flavobacterium xanthum]SHM14006.1 arsenate reductase [Flavobacterium xanthum]
MLQIYHNSRCGKSRQCLALMQNSNLEFEVIHYLTHPPSFDELATIIEKLNIKPIALVRQKEKIWIENYKDQKLDDKQIILAMISNPILIEIPIVVKGSKAIIGRDLVKVSTFIS